MLSSSDSWRLGESWCEGERMLWFSLFKSLKFPVSKELRGHIVSVSWCLLICFTKLRAVLSSEWTSVGWWVNLEQGTCNPLAWLCVTNCTATACAWAHESWCIISTLPFSCILTSSSCTAPLPSQVRFPVLAGIMWVNVWWHASSWIGWHL